MGGAGKVRKGEFFVPLRVARRSRAQNTEEETLGATFTQRQ